MNSRTWIHLLLLVALSCSVTAAVDHCRCAFQREGDLYHRRRLAHEVQAQHGHDSVKIDSNGYYIINKVRVLPVSECEHHRNLQAAFKNNDNDDEHTLRRALLNLFARMGGWDPNEDQKPEDDVFLCDSLTVQTPPSHSSLTEEAEKFLEQELTKDVYKLDDHNHLIMVTPTKPAMRTHPDGSLYVVESLVDCETLPLAAWFNRAALPFHCRCPTNVDPSMLPDECHVV